LEPNDIEALDEDRAIACGLDVDHCHHDEEMPYRYIYEVAVCWNGDCKMRHYYIPYGQRWYWDEEAGNFEADAPLSPQERIMKENAYQESMGQLLLDFPSL
jgi:hypothetical protein